MYHMKQKLKNALALFVDAAERQKDLSPSLNAAYENAKNLLEQYERMPVPTGFLADVHAAVEQFRERQFPNMSLQKHFVLVTEDNHPSLPWWESNGPIVHEHYLARPNTHIREDVYDAVKRLQANGQRAQAFLLVPVDIVKYMENGYENPNP